ncbi:ABC transporter ATP-binding protein [Virgibacillus sp. NKC19-16]|uniref:ABC transporter ATP-binding protein n=1 Tax=Virgibacillus salidurans TaxID=2831673 RepID=UPI001F2DC2FE|nr:ABC transporter ATP-binding protein [Virgibacillus sp. NKC19-16]UJL46429.1 ABC transporter ATP-binding protein [Virgibacillus sp. NKC19-16]
MMEFYLEEKSYGKNFHISNVDIKINPGEVLCLLGHNGAGKTTIIKSIFGLIKYQGNMSINHRRIDLSKEEDIDFFKKHVAYIPDEVNIFPFLTPKEVFELLANKNKETNTKFLQKLIDIFELNQYINVPISSLSHGNKKKTQIVSYLFRKPAFVIFDEPTNGLDPDMTIVLRKVIKLLRQQKMGILLSTHNLSFGDELYDKLVILRNGVVKLTANFENVIKTYGNVGLEEVYTKINEDYYKQVDAILYE